MGGSGDVGWQSQTTNGLYQNHHLINGLNGFLPSPFLVTAKHRAFVSPDSPPPFISFEDKKNKDLSALPHKSCEERSLDEDFGDFVSVTAAAATLAQEEDKLPAFSASELILRMHGAALSKALRSRVDNLHSRPGALDYGLEVSSDVSAKSASKFDSFSMAQSLHSDWVRGQASGDLSEMEDLEWNDFVQSSETMATTNQIPLAFSVEPKLMNGGSRERLHEPETLSEGQKISSLEKNPPGLVFSKDLGSSNGLSFMSEDTSAQSSRSDDKGLSGSSCLKVQGASLKRETFGCSQEDVEFDESQNATLLADNHTVTTTLDGEEGRFVETNKSTGFSSQDEDITNQLREENFNLKQMKAFFDGKISCRSLKGITLQIEESATFQDRLAYILAWDALASVCASEMAHGRAIWQLAKQAGLCSSLLSHIEGKKYFLALGQVHAVHLILEVASQLYSSWIEKANERGKSLSAILEQCKIHWTELKDAVYWTTLEVEQTSSWPISGKCLEIFCSVDKLSDIISTETENQAFCRLSLIPLHDKLGVPTVRWNEHHYLLPIANLWANFISVQPPSLPSIIS